MNPSPTPLHEDLLTLILLCLPLKSIARFKSVSKQWLSLITTTPQFSLPKPIKALISHSTNTNHKPQLFSLDNNTTLLGGASLTQHESCVSSHSCNGLLLCCLRTDESWLFKLFVSNPTTGRYETLDLHYPPSYHFLSLAAYVAFDPSAKPHYEIVCFCTADWYDTEIKIMIYSSESSTWRLARPCLPLPHTLRSYDKGVFWNGSIYWASTPHKLGNRNKQELYRFDLEQERIQQVEDVTCSGVDGHVLYLGLCRGSLRVVKGVYDCDGKIQMLNVYSIGNESEEWRLENVVHWPFEHRHNEFKVVFLDSEEIMCLYFRVGKVIARYDFGARTVVKVFEDVDFGTFYSQHMEILYSSGLTHTGPILIPSLEKRKRD